MIKFLAKGLLRDRSRSLFPVMITTTGVMLTVVVFSWINGFLSESVSTTARFDTGHVCIMSRAYAQESDQIPNDLALLGVDGLMESLENRYPNMIWTPRIHFGGLLDIPDEKGETRTQGPFVGFGVDLLSENTPELEIMNLEKGIINGTLPSHAGEVLLSDEFARKLGVRIGDTATIISSTMYGGMALANFTVAGTVRFGINAIDRSAMIADIEDVRQALDMEDGAGEILGFFPDFYYDHLKAEQLASDFNAMYTDSKDEFSPVMSTLKEQSGMADILDLVGSMYSIIIVFFIFVMSIVLWNAGLMGSLRRYGEIGVRLAMGETKGHVYRSMLSESLLIGFVGSVFGTILGLGFAFLLQEKGIPIAGMMKNASMLFSDVMRARVTIGSYFIGLIPGLAATFLGTSVAGIGIYRRQTSQLFKELEA